ncbi:non-structural maintenance of chromosomes element 3 homolog isoform X2 [Littorina saxatilis]|uniref:non-structural maintenance of chromosomes element 3 homolog isoform X2 n=1 Tax=Littorina saxatilis TaxID=31220 RepID=UPI0038B5E9ED
MWRKIEEKQAANSTQAGASTSSQMAPPLSQTQQSQAEKVAATMDRTELNKKVEELVQYLLIMDQKKLPIKKQDINKMVMKDASRALPVVIKKASERLSQVFGIKVVELQDKFKGSYILVNDLETHDVVMWPELDSAKTGLLTVILSTIYMSGNVIQDGELWHGLKNLGIDPDIIHETFGDVKKLVTQEFVKQAYLEFTKLPNAEQPVFEVRWGQRAKLETTKLQILKFVSLMYSKDPSQWTSQYQDAKDATEEGASAS